MTITASGFVDTDNVAADQRAVRIPGRATLAGARRDEAFSRRARAQVLFTNATIACLPEKEGGGAPIAPTQRSPACGGGRPPDTVSCIVHGWQAHLQENCSGAGPRSRNIRTCAKLERLTVDQEVGGSSPPSCTGNQRIY